MQKTTTDRKTMAGRLNKKKKRQECNLWYFSKFKLGMGIPKQTDHWRPALAHSNRRRCFHHHCLVGWICVGWMVTRASNISRRSALFVRHYVDPGPQQTLHANDRRFFPE
jgi:hypothetical protein